MKIFDKIRKFWYFHIANPTIRKGESGGFKWKFRRFWLEIKTVSGNFKARWTADKDPYGYLLAGKGDENIQGFAERIYMISKLLTTDQKFVSDIDRALKNYNKRLSQVKPDKDDSEEIALEEVKQIQEYVEMPKKARRKYEKDVDKRFKESNQFSRNVYM